MRGRDCSIPFSTISLIKGCLPHLDIILNIAIGSDFIRNVGKAILDARFSKVRSKKISFLGSDAFFGTNVL